LHDRIELSSRAGNEGISEAADDTVILDRFPGQPIQFDPEDQPRFEPVSVEVWEQSFITGTPHLEGSEFAEPAQD